MVPQVAFIGPLRQPRQLRHQSVDCLRGQADGKHVRFPLLGRDCFVGANLQRRQRGFADLLQRFERLIDFVSNQSRLPMRPSD